MRTQLTLVLAIALALLSNIGFADTPKTIAAPHGHALNVQGKITMFRVQQQGLEVGDKPDFLDAEVLVTLDTQPGKVFGIRLHGDSEANR